MTDDWLPDRTYAAAVELFGQQFHNPKARSRVALARRTVHALRVWGEKYGPLNDDQRDYADEVLAAALRIAARDARGSRDNLFRFAQAAIGRTVNHERVDQGFKRRSGLVDVGNVLEGVA